MEELIENSGKVPLTRKVMVNEDSILDLLDRIRTTIPEEIRQAKWIIQEREKVMSDSQKEAMNYGECPKQVEKQAEDSEVARNVVAEEIIAKAEQTAQECVRVPGFTLTKFRVPARQTEQDKPAN